jgi:uncharacterized membrane protein
MTKAKFKMSAEDKNRIVEAIKKAELNTSGEIRVHVQEILIGDIFEEAKKKFEELGMTATEQRNGTLIFISTKERQMAILGDEGINKVVPDCFWQETVDMMIEFFKKDNLVGGIEAGVLTAGDALKKYFPYQSDDKNELDNDVSIG